jgi:hypothetical protein
MKPRITLNTFRRIGHLEETMIRAAMPRTSDRDAEPLAPFAGRPEVNVLARRAGVNLVRPLTATVAEVARA